MADLSIEVGGITFKNPVMLASSEVTEDFYHMKQGIDMGAGAVVAKSYCTEEEVKRQTDLAKYCVLDYDRKQFYGRDVPKFYTLYSRCGTIQVSEQKWLEELERTEKYASEHDAHVIGSVFGHKDVSEMVRLAKEMEQIGLKMLEFDLGCPHPAEMKSKGALLKATEEYYNTTRILAEAVSIPIMIKLSPQQADLGASAQGVKETGADGVTCHNRFLGFAIDIENARPYIWGWAGVGGPWMLPIAVGWVSKIYNAEPDFPIFASSGAYDWEDVVQFLMAGARGVQFCSTVMVKGYCVIKEAVQGLNSFLDAKGYRSVKDIIGIATRASHTYEEMYTLDEYKEVASIDSSRCIGTDCKRCMDACWYAAIEVSNGGYRVMDGKCKGCYNCQIVCPIEGCITMRTIGW